MDEHLRTIEAALQVSIAHRHEQFKVDGPKAKATRAMEVLQALYEMAARPIEAAKVQLMLASDMDLGEVADGALVLNTRRTDLRARTPTQSVYLDNIATPRHHLRHWPGRHRQNLSGRGHARSMRSSAVRCSALC
jgi:phosphate starvation-inducible PhoH-like protein